MYVNGRLWSWSGKIVNSALFSSDLCHAISRRARPAGLRACDAVRSRDVYGEEAGYAPASMAGAHCASDRCPKIVPDDFRRTGSHPCSGHK